MYVKLFSSIYQGTLRGRPHCLLVFTNLLAHADSHGEVDIHPNSIADEIGLDIEEVRKTLLILEEPDSESRSPESEGRRIVRLDGHRAWGWQIVNYVKYRSIKNEDDRREQNRAAQERWRNKHKPPSADVSTVSPDKPKQKQRQIQKKKEEIQAPPTGVAPSVWSDWMTIRRSKKLPWTETAWSEIQSQIDLAGISVDQAIRECCARGWGSFKAEWHNKHNGNQQETFKQRDARESRRKWEQATGGKHPDSDPDDLLRIAS